MRTFEYEFGGINGFKIFAQFIHNALLDIEQNSKGILVQRLLLHILSTLYETKILPRTVRKRKRYLLKLNDAQAVAVALALHNHSSQEEQECGILQGILYYLTTYLDQPIEPLALLLSPPNYQDYGSQ